MVKSPWVQLRRSGSGRAGFDDDKPLGGGVQPPRQARSQCQGTQNANADAPAALACALLVEFLGAE